MTGRPLFLYSPRMRKTEKQRRGRARAIGWLPRPTGALAAASIWFAACGDDNTTNGFPTDNSGLMAGHAQGKFCHDLVHDGAKVELTLEIGTPTLARFTASTASCSPILGSPCTVLPVGYLPARLLEGTTVLSSGALRIGLGGKYIYRARITDHPTIMPIGIDPAVSCEATEVDFSDGGVATDGAATDGAVADGGVADAGAPDAAATDAAAGADLAQQPGDDAPADVAVEVDTASPDAAAGD
jgi:hypothetical protein